MLLTLLLLLSLPQQQVQKLVASDATFADGFGNAVDIDGNVAIVGAVDKPNGLLNGAGAAYVFRRTGGVWSEEAKLVPPSPEFLDHFGHSVAIQGDLAVIGAPDTFFATYQGTGRAWVFRRVAGVWTMEQELVPTTATLDSQVGTDVALDGNTIVVTSWPSPFSTPSVSTVFEMQGGSWVETENLITPGTSSYSVSIDLEGDRLAVNAQEVVQGMPDIGTVHVYERVAGVWSLASVVLPPPNVDSREWFGVDFDLSGNHIAVGASGEEIVGNPGAGRVDIFRNIAGTWTLEEKVETSWPQTLGGFGTNVALENGTMLSTSWSSTAGSPHLRGAGHIYQEVGAGEWVGGSPIYPPVLDYTGFGRSCAMSGDTAIFGTFQFDARIFSLNSGFRLNGPGPFGQLESENDNIFSVTGGNPNQMTWLTYSLFGFGNFFVPQLFVNLDLSIPMVAGAPAMTDANGNASWTVYVPASAADFTAWWQAVQFFNKSNTMGTIVN